MYANDWLLCVPMAVLYAYGCYVSLRLTVVYASDWLSFMPVIFVYAYGWLLCMPVTDCEVCLWGVYACSVVYAYTIV